MNIQKRPLFSYNRKTALSFALGLMTSLGLYQTALADFYVGALIGSGMADQKIESELEAFGHTVEIDDSNIVYTVFGGLSILDSAEGINWDVEGFYTNFGDPVDGKFSQEGLVEGRFSGSASTFGIAAVPSFKIGAVDIFGKLGLHRYSAESAANYTGSGGTVNTTEEETEFSYVFGAGVKYAISEGLTFVALAEQYKFDINFVVEQEDMNILDGVTVPSVGVQANF